MNAILDFMRRIFRILGGFVLVLALAAIAMSFAGYRLAVDGSGKMPRFVTRSSIDALEADRARQRETAQPSLPASNASLLHVG